MSVDTSIQYNGYNSYKFIQGETLNCYPFGVENMSHITHSFGAYSPIALASEVRANTKFFDADSEILQSVDHSFAIGAGIFENKSITVEVPTGAMKAQLTFKNPAANTWWVATPKTEEGQTATPYAINAYGQLTYITPNGIYTGILTAEQIVLASNENLSDRLTTINANQITLQNGLNTATGKITTLEAGQILLESGINSLDDDVVKKGESYAGTKITAEDGFENTAIIGGQTVKVKLNATEGLGIYADDVFIGGINVINGIAGLTARRIGAIPECYGEIGIAAGSVGLALYDLRYNSLPFVKIAELANGTGFSIRDKNNYPRFEAGNTIRITDRNNTLRFYADDNDTRIKDKNGINRFYADDAYTRIKDKNDSVRFQATDNGTWLQSPNGNTYLYVSDTKIQVIVNGVVKETWS